MINKQEEMAMIDLGKKRGHGQAGGPPMNVIPPPDPDDQEPAHKGWSRDEEAYVAGYRCSCGELYPDRRALFPWRPPPTVCWECGEPQTAWERRSLRRTIWIYTSWWPPFCRGERMATYRPGRPLDEHQLCVVADTEKDLKTGKRDTGGQEQYRDSGWLVPKSE
jgi:hypothetical protein